MDLIYAGLALAAVVQVLVHLFGSYEARFLRELGDVAAPEPATWPTLSVVVTACNEEATIDAAMRSLLAVDYPKLEVIAVDDRSTDATGAILDSLAAAHPRLKVVHNEVLPPRWLGKVHAMHLGTEASAGEFIVFCDADVHFQPEVLRWSMAWVVDEAVDHLSLIPKLIGNSALALGVIHAIGGAWVMGTRPSRVNRDKPGGYGGCGAFNLVRRDALKKTEGWPWLRMEIADDVGLGFLLHRHGFRSRLGLASTGLQIEWYADVGEVIAGMEKNIFAVAAQFSVARALAMSLAIIVGTASPWLLLFTPWAWVGVAAFLGIVLATSLRPSGAAHWFHSLLSTQMGPVLVWTMMRSMVKIVARGEVDWRGTRYSISELKAEQRVKL